MAKAKAKGNSTAKAKVKAKAKIKAKVGWPTSIVPPQGVQVSTYMDISGHMAYVHMDISKMYTPIVFTGILIVDIAHHVQFL